MSNRYTELLLPPDVPRDRSGVNFRIATAPAGFLQKGIAQPPAIGVHFRRGVDRASPRNVTEKLGERSFNSRQPTLPGYDLVRMWVECRNLQLQIQRYRSIGPDAVLRYTTFRLGETL